MPNIAVILSGCGYLDGAEIRESVLSLLYLDEAGADVSIFAPEDQQYHVINHQHGEAAHAQRSIIEEAARIARGKIMPLHQLNPEQYDGLIIPGGFGVAKNFSDIAFKGAGAHVDPTISAVVQGFYDARKPIGAICISPVLLSAILRNQAIELTIGEDKFFADLIEGFGNKHRRCDTGDAVIDTQHRIASCSAYMRDDASLSHVAQGIKKVIEYVVTSTPKA
jgi:enhancing lycopene biosynthesis protein 2